MHKSVFVHGYENPLLCYYLLRDQKKTNIQPTLTGNIFKYFVCLARRPQSNNKAKEKKKKKSFVLQLLKKIKSTHSS